EPPSPGARPTTSTSGAAPLAHHGCPAASAGAMRPSSTISHAGGGDHAPEPEPMQPDSAIAITAHRFMGEGKASVAPAQAREAAWPGCSSDGQPLRIATARAKVIGSNDADESLH